MQTQPPAQGIPATLQQRNTRNTRNSLITLYPVCTYRLMRNSRNNPATPKGIFRKGCCTLLHLLRIKRNPQTGRAVFGCCALNQSLQHFPRFEGVSVKSRAGSATLSVNLPS